MNIQKQQERVANLLTRKEINSITIVCQQGTNRYQIGDVVNGVEIVEIRDVSLEYPDSLHVGFNCLSGDSNTNSRVIVEMWDVPVVVEYYDKIVEDKSC